MASAELEEYCSHINAKIGSVKKLLQLRTIGCEESLKAMLAKVRQEMAMLHQLLDLMEGELNQQQHLAAVLHEMRRKAEMGRLEAEQFHRNVPAELHRGSRKEPLLTKKPVKEKKVVKDALLITQEEFKSIPGYMRGRLTLAQINATLCDLHAAAASKYRILRQRPKSMTSTTRSLYHRFQEEETKDTKGAFFVVEADLKEFTQLRVDRRFYAILNVLRHCKRVREVRGGHLVRYVLC